MNNTKKDRIIFTIYIIGFSVISILVGLVYSFENGLVMGIVLGIGILLCVGARQIFKETTSQKNTKVGIE